MPRAAGGTARDTLGAVSTVVSLCSALTTAVIVVTIRPGQVVLPGIAFAVAVASGVFAVCKVEDHRLVKCLIGLAIGACVVAGLLLPPGDGASRSDAGKGGGFRAGFQHRLHHLKVGVAQHLDFGGLAMAAIKAGLYVSSPHGVSYYQHGRVVPHTEDSAQDVPEVDPSSQTMDADGDGRTMVQVADSTMTFTDALDGSEIRPPAVVTTEPGVGDSSDLPLKVAVLGRWAFATDPSKSKVWRYELSKAAPRPVSVEIYGRPVAITEGFGFIWVTSSTGWLTRIDPETKQVRRLRVGGPLGPVVAAFGEVWVVKQGERCMARVDPVAWTVRDCRQGPLPGAVSDAIAWHNSVVVASADADTVTQLDRRANLFATHTRAGWAPIALAPADGRLYALSDKTHCLRQVFAPALGVSARARRWMEALRPRPLLVPAP